MNPSQLVFALVLISSMVSCTQKPSSEDEKAESVSGVVSVAINIDDREITFDSLSLEGGATVYDVLMRLDQNPRGITVTDTLYDGLGHLIIGFDTILNNRPNYWIYCLNNKKANKGVDAMTLKDGDLVTWFYTNGDTPCK